MSFSPRIGLALGICVVAALAGCSFAPYKVDGSDEAAKIAKVEGADMLPSLQPYAIGICYSPAFNEPAEVEAEAVYRCDGGRLEKQEEDFFWNGCSLSQPNRVNYVCFPPDKAKSLN